MCILSLHGVRFMASSSLTGSRQDSTSITPLLESIHSTLTAKHGTFINGIRELKRLFKDMDIRPLTTGATGFSGSGTGFSGSGRGEGKEGKESGGDVSGNGSGSRYLSSYELKKALVAAKVSYILLSLLLCTYIIHHIYTIIYVVYYVYIVGSR